MASPAWPNLLSLYMRVVDAGVIDCLLQQAGLKTKRGIYGPRVVLWLMMRQRMQGRGTTASAIQGLIAGAADPLLADCQRIRQGRISCRNGGYCQARQKLPNLLCRQVSQEMIARLRQMLASHEPNQSSHAFVLDGSSLELEHVPILLERFPPTVNQHGRGHWPVLRLVVLHDVHTGLAQSPCWGPMYGAQAVSEQQLAETALSTLPSGSIVIGDRNFGIFSIAYAARQRGLDVVVRMTDVRAHKLAGTISQPGEHPVLWQPSRWERRRSAQRPAEASVEGRLIAARVGQGQAKRWLYLFTTTSLPAAQVVDLYARRQLIETDLRSLKRTVQLHHLNVKSEEMMDKEILMAVSAYNLVRAVMCLAAGRHHLNPRQLSFTHALNVIDAQWINLIGASSAAQQDAFLRVLDLAAQGLLPVRRKHRAYPRRRWRRGGTPRFRKEETK